MQDTATLLARAQLVHTDACKQIAKSHEVIAKSSALLNVMHDRLIELQRLSAKSKTTIATSHDRMGR